MTNKESTHKEEDNMYGTVLRAIKGSKKTTPQLTGILSKKSSATSASANGQNQVVASKIPVYPVPKLNETIERFLRTCKPLLSEQELACTSKLALDFACDENSQGQCLQNLLEERAKKMDNWLADWWIQTAYLSYRSAVLCWSSPGLVYPLTSFESVQNKIHYTGKLAAGALNYKIKIDRGEIKQEMLGKQPMDMQQYHKVFGTCRIPGKCTDTMSYNPQSRHIIIISNNHYFEVDCFDDCNNPLSPRQMEFHLDCVVRQSFEAAPPIGILSGQNRDKWHEVYCHLMQNECNKKAIERIQSALFVVCLDKSVDDNCHLNEQTRASQQTIYGGGSRHNAANRWYDKTIQFIVSDDGINGLTYEHAPAEGGPVAAMSDFIADYMKESKIHQDAVKTPKEMNPRELKFEIDSCVESAIKCAAQEVDNLTSDLDMACFSFCDYGKEFIKSQKLGPDSYIQMAMQYAYFQTHQEPAATYESCAMRHFIHGRTETIRSCSTESLNFTKAMLCESTPDAEKAEYIRRAVAGHKDYITLCLKGQGIDRHFLGLKLIAAENGIKLHPLFCDPGYLKSSYYKLATSQVPLKANGFMCYGPVVKDGYGCCYNPRSDDIVFAVSSFKSDPQTSSEKFKENLTKSLRHMFKVLSTNQKSNL